MLAISAQTGPVFLPIRHRRRSTRSSIDDGERRRCSTSSRPTASPRDLDDGLRDDHARWSRRFAAIPALYIADGHHRAASAARTRRALAGRGAGEHDRVLAVAFPDNQMQILPYNRVVKDLNGLTPTAFLDGDRQRTWRSTTRPSGAVARKGQAAMYLDGRWYTLDLGAAAAGAMRAAALDVSRAAGQRSGAGPRHPGRPHRQAHRLRRRHSRRRRTRSVSSMREQFAVAFSLFPVTVGDLMTIADAGGIMPPKSTWFEPKLRDGLLSI